MKIVFSIFFLFSVFLFSFFLFFLKIYLDLGFEVDLGFGRDKNGEEIFFERD